MTEIYLSIHWIDLPKCRECGENAALLYSWMDEHDWFNESSQETFYCEVCAKELGIEIPPRLEREKEEEENP
jgi:hypothetical protein